jgi:hypothetical protein
MRRILHHHEGDHDRHHQGSENVGQPRRVTHDGRTDQRGIEQTEVFGHPLDRR